MERGASRTRTGFLRALGYISGDCNELGWKGESYRIDAIVCGGTPRRRSRETQSCVYRLESNLASSEPPTAPPHPSLTSQSCPPSRSDNHPAPTPETLR